MAESIFTFTWPVSLGGYWWEKGPPSKSRVARLAWDERAHVRCYSPLREETGLFLTLAKTPPEPDAMLGFANRYGNLGEGVDLPRIVKSEVGPDGCREIVEVCVEPLGVWAAAICWLHQMVKLWQAARAGDEKTLTEFLFWDGDRVILHGVPYGALELTCKCDLADDFGFYADGRCISRGDNVAAAFLHLHERLNRWLHRLVSPTLTWDRDARKSELTFSVRSLWGAILFQFAEAIGGQHDYQRCDACSRWFELAPGVNRADRLTCSDSCRQKFYRMRKGRAIELHAQGKNLRAIAKEIRSDVKTIKGWIARRKEK
jgi:hypothetical protein